MKNILRDSNRLMRHSLLLMAATQVGNVANLLFQALMMRRLPENEYGALAAMLGLATIIATPLEALRTSAAQFAARLRRQQRAHNTGRLARKWIIRLLLPAAALIISGCIGTPVLTELFQLPSDTVIIVTASVMALSVFMPVLTGILQGIEAFGWFAAVAPAWGLGRLAAGFILTSWIAATATAGLASQMIGIILAIAIAGVGLRRSIPGKTSDAPELSPPPAAAYLSGSFLILLFYAALMNGDVAMVKLLFPPDITGTFARAASIARIVVFLPMPIALAMFPKVVSDATGTLNGEQRKTFRLALIFTTGMTVVAAGICSLCAGLLWRVFTGNPCVPEELHLLRRLIWALTPYAPTFLILNYQMAQTRFHAAGRLAVMAVAYIIALALFHNSLGQITVIIAITALTTLAVTACSPRFFTARRKQT